jgi:hypothetical protein
MLMKLLKVLKVLLVIGGALAILCWVALIFYAFFLGGSPGPGHERTVPLSYCSIMATGLLGSVIGIAGIAVSQLRKLLPLAAALGATGSSPLFLLELPTVGVLFLIIGIAPLLGLFCYKNIKENNH